MKIPELLASWEKSDLGTRSPSSEVCQSLATATPVKEAWLLWPPSMRTPQFCHSPDEPVSPFMLPVWTLRSLQFESPRARPAISCNGFQTGFPRDLPASGGVGAGSSWGVWCVGSEPLAAASPLSAGPTGLLSRIHSNKEVCG